MAKKILIGLAIILLIAGCVKVDDGALGLKGTKTSASGWGAEHGFPTIKEISGYWGSSGKLDLEAQSYVGSIIQKCMTLSLAHHMIKGIGFDCADAVEPGEPTGECEKAMAEMDDEARQEMSDFPMPDMRHTMKNLLDNPSTDMCAGDRDCIEMVAMLRNDQGICGLGGYYDDCELSVAMYNNDPSFCSNSHVDDSEMADCLTLFNLEGSLDDEIAALQG